MTTTNKTHLTEFILLGLSNHVPLLLFLVFSLIYIFTLMGNMMIILTVTLVPQLHSPMYLFLRSLSLTEIFYISVTVPRMLKDFLDQNKHISLIGCAAQTYFFGFLATTECFLLAVMAYDRYVAICQPLHYVTIMNKRKYMQFSLGSWITGMILSLGQTTYVFSLPFCGPNIIDHFFCDILPVVRLACADTLSNEISILIYSSLVVPFPFLFILVSYARILTCVFRMRNVAGHKAFSTCGSHLTSVSLFYGTATITYLRTKSSNINTKVFSLFYLVFTPMLNPLIYSLRNKEMKNATRTLIFKRSRLFEISQ
ncbi:olfactory receptor 10A7-like [Discoglossus pictus]